MWKHRVVVQDDPSPFAEEGVRLYAIHEWYHTIGAKGSITACPIHPQGENLSDLHEELTWMLEAVQAVIDGKEEVLELLDFTTTT